MSIRHENNVFFCFFLCWEKLSLSYFYRHMEYTLGPKGICVYQKDVYNLVSVQVANTSLGIIKGEAVVSNCLQQTTASFQGKQAGFKLKFTVRAHYNTVNTLPHRYTHPHKLKQHVFAFSDQ